MQHAATDPTTGIIDMDGILIGRTAKSQDKMQRLKTMIETILNANVYTFKKSSTMDALKKEIERNWDHNEEPVLNKEILQALKILETDGVIFLFGQYQHKPNFKLVVEN